ncbi:hypothetical protein AK812_SmicGene23709 [Symbiodinium microadriaticum]|uniref:Uncharacterized protein n=1 Tax=Symbiodinium microadriaticum TaxID=2951 RepID=A0A1Q9DGJ0_SYMMI|nr:hypothetical protein AK812_SmicGene23709 [Symbiodinium microadriaticum]
MPLQSPCSPGLTLPDVEIRQPQEPVHAVKSIRDTHQGFGFSPSAGSSPAAPDLLMHVRSLPGARAHETRKSFQRPKFWVLSFGWFLAGYYDHDESEAWAMTKARPTLLIDKNQVHFGGKSWYGVALVGNAVLIFGAALAPNLPTLSVCLAATACGLQNAMCTSHFGAVVRTTHVTGTLTDIGSTLGRIAMVYLRKGCRRSRMNVLEKAEIGVDARKLLVLLPMWVSFVMGSTVGAYAEHLFGVYALFFPASMTLTVGLVYMFLRQVLADVFARIEQEGLREKLMDMHLAFQRAGTRLSDAEGGVAGELQELDDEMGTMLEALDEVGSGVETLCKLSGSQLSMSLSHLSLSPSRRSLEKTPIHGVADSV